MQRNEIIANILRLFAIFAVFIPIICSGFGPFQLHCQEIGRKILFAFALQISLAPQTPLVCYIQIALALLRS